MQIEELKLEIFSNTNQIMTVMTKEKKRSSEMEDVSREKQVTVKKLFPFPPEITQRSLHCQMS